MNNELFQQAKTAVGAKDFTRALSLYAQCLDDQTHPLEEGERGLIYHQMGNCFTKMKSYDEAIEAYSQAATDTAYDACGTVNYNMGMAYAAVHDLAQAVKHFELAVSDNQYPTPYKAYQGMGTALLKQGKSAEAGVAFREAALDESNPDPTKALLNLGVCFMALNRPADAVASYESALQFDMMPDMRNKMYASLGQAYAAAGQMEKSLDAFERSLADGTYHLSASASVDYQRAMNAVAQGNADGTQALPLAADMSGIDVVAADEGYSTDPYVVEEPSEAYYFADAYEESDDPTASQERFFNATDDELEEWSRDVVKKERKRKSVGLKVLVAIILILILALGAGVFLYWQGFGYPTQETAIEQVFADPSKSEAWAEGVDPDNIARSAELIPAGSKINIDGIDKSMSSSTAYVTLTTPKGGDVQYVATLVRDKMIGWKVADIDLYFASRN